jgi:hypothetical protein
VAHVTKASCTGSRCALRVRVTDVGFSAGIRRVRATVRSTYRAICRRGAERVACTRNVTRKAKVTRVRGTTFRVVASALRAGTHVFTIVAVDRAGHVQRLPTRRTLRTKRR